MFQNFELQETPIFDHFLISFLQHKGFLTILVFSQAYNFDPFLKLKLLTMHPASSPIPRQG